MKAAVCMLLLALSPGIGAEPLGRLFFTAQQRALFDAARNTDAVAPVAVKGFRLDGRIVRRSGGDPSGWINGRPALPSLVDSTGLRVGESLDAGSGEKCDLVPRGGIVVRPAPP